MTERTAYSRSDYIADNYGTCDREVNCYWGKNARGEFDEREQI